MFLLCVADMSNFWGFLSHNVFYCGELTIVTICMILFVQHLYGITILELIPQINKVFFFFLLFAVGIFPNLSLVVFFF